MTETISFLPPVPDLVITGGRVIDPIREVDRLADVSVRAGRIAAVGHDLAAGVPRDRVVDATGLLVTPGLIDIHTRVHPVPGGGCVVPDVAGVERGVPVVVAAGTSGTATIGLTRAGLEAAGPRTRVLSFVDPRTLYLATHDALCERLAISGDPRNVDLDAVAAVLDAHPDFVVGLSVRASPGGNRSAAPGLDGTLAVAGDRPVMVHLGRAASVPAGDAPAWLDALRPGDVVTHAFRAGSGLVDPATGVPAPALAAAVERGVRLDVGRGSRAFRFPEARRLLAAGYPPDTVSTALDASAAARPGASLTEAMSELWALGVGLHDVVAMATGNAAAAIGRSHELGSLAPGRPAEISVLEVVRGPAELSDGHETLIAGRRLVPVGCVRAGGWVEATAPSPAPAGIRHDFVSL